MGSSWRSLTGDRRNKDGDKGHDEGSEEQQRPEPCPSQAPEPNQTQTWRFATPTWITKSLTKSSKPEGSHSHFGNAKESNSQWPVCNPPITCTVVISSFTYTVFKELEKQSGIVTRERSERGKGNEVIIISKFKKSIKTWKILFAQQKLSPQDVWSPALKIFQEAVACGDPAFRLLVSRPAYCYHIYYIHKNNLQYTFQKKRIL